MTRILYLDCFSGISGDMFLGALLDLGVPLAFIETELAKLGLSTEYAIHAEKISRSGIQGTALTVRLTAEHSHSHNHDHDHDHSHNHGHNHGQAAGHHAGFDQGRTYLHHHGRTYADIKQLIETAPLAAAVRERALAVFLEIGVAEAAVHGVALEQVHFHEVGAIDSLVDIVGGAIALDYLQIDRVVVSPIADGTGTIRCQHGVMPVPVPAVMKMLENTDIPYITGTSYTELVTPTGLGLAKTFAQSFGAMPQMKRLAIGYGFGQRDIGRLNALRVILGESTEKPLQPGFDPQEIDEVILLSCHVDNKSSEDLGYLMQLLFQAGAADVTYTPILMKKNRPGQLLTIVAPLEREATLVDLIFRHGGTIGIRRERIERHVMRRSQQTLEVAGLTVRLKKVQWQSIERIYPEPDDLAALANHLHITLDEARLMISVQQDRT